MEQLIPIIISAAMGLTAIVGSVFVSRRFQKLGGGEAQNRLNVILQGTVTTLEAIVAALEIRLTAADLALAESRSRLEILEGMVTEMRKERQALKQDIDDLHNEVRVLKLTNQYAKNLLNVPTENGNQ